MPLVDPHTYGSRPKPRAKRRWPYIVLLLVVLVGIINFARPLPKTTPYIRVPSLPAAQEPSLPWPSAGQAALAAENYGLLSTHGEQTPIPTASIAKAITALCVLQKAPLDPGKPGPTYIVGRSDIDIYNQYLGQDASLVPVAPGESLTEQQALEALMIPSANNIADSLAAWVFGSQANYAAYAKTYLLQHGIAHTQIGVDASGFDPSTTSTAADVAQIGLLALQNPTLMAIAGEKSVTLPVVGLVYNYDSVLGQNGITGLKTGNSEQDTGAFLFTARIAVAGKSVQIAGAIMGQASLDDALHSAVALAGAAQSGFTNATSLSKNQAVGTLRTAWGTQAPIVTAKAVSMLRWKDTPLSERHTVHPSNGRGGTVGALEILSGDNGTDTPLVITKPAPAPSFWWRLSRH